MLFLYVLYVCICLDFVVSGLCVVPFGVCACACVCWEGLMERRKGIGVGMEGKFC